MDAMSSQSPPEFTANADEEVVQHIDMLHDRIQFLTEEMEKAERTILELRQDDVPPSDERVTLDLSEHTFGARLVRYGVFLTEQFDEDEDDVKMLLEDVAGRFEEYVDSTEELHNASVALLTLLLKHEDVAR